MIRDVLSLIDIIRSYENLVDELLVTPRQVNSYADLKRLEMEMIARAIEECGGNKREAAIRLGVKRTTLLDRMRRGVEE